jgi:ADP-heptose:LPS heptosyltransferase
MKKVALILCRTLGDVVLVHNLVDGIYKKYGEVVVDVYVDEFYKDLVFGNPKIARIFTSPSWLSNWDSLIETAIVKGTYDAVLCPQQTTREDTIWHQLDYLRHQHLVDYYLSRCYLPKREEGEELQLFSTSHDHAAVDRVLAVNKLKHYVVIHTTSGVPSKDWDYFPGLVYSLLDEGKTVLQVGGGEDKLAVSERVGFFDLRKQFTFPQIAALCKRASCFVGLDSGLSFVAAASKTPTIVLQGSTVPETSGPWGKNVINILSKTLPQCEEVRCHTNCRFPRECKGKCINYIEVTEVLDAIKGVEDESNLLGR